MFKITGDNIRCKPITDLKKKLWTELITCLIILLNLDFTNGLQRFKHDVRKEGGVSPLQASDQKPDQGR
jgi:hypothetical protein